MHKKTKALLQSAVSLLLCFSMLMGTTFAWFTDSVTSSGNIITTGNLDLEMYWTDKLDGSNTSWKDVEDAADNTIFNHDNWEPGYTQVRYIKLVNAGNLALKYQLAIAPVGAVGELADAIRVYSATSTTGVVVGEYADLSNLSSHGILRNVLNGGATAPEGNLQPNGEVIITLAMSMDTAAGNEYQSKDAGAFTVKALATQHASESDSFGADYDSGAQYDDGASSGGGISTTIASVNVTPTDAGTVPVGGVTMSGTGASAAVPAGVQLNDNTTKLTLSVAPLANSAANVAMDENEVLIPVDVHIEGVAENNTVPIIISIKEALPVGLNIGNYRLVHVEDGATNTMTSVASLEDVDAHNEFYYDPATGDVTVAMATFSEVALVADTENAWNGDIAEGFAGGTGTEDDPYIIANADQLAYLNEVISNDNENYSDKYYKLVADINLGGEEAANNEIIFYPIGYHKEGGVVAALADDDAPEAAYIIEEDTKLPGSTVAENATTWYTFGGSFSGTFDGAGHTISNIYQNTWQLKGNYDGNYWNAAMGLFGYVHGGTVKNLTVNNFTSDGEFTPTGVIAAYAANATFENIAITNCNPRVYNTGNGGIVGIGGNTSDNEDAKLTFTNITIDNTNKISALWGSWDVACGGLVGMFRGAGHVYMTNCHVAAQIDVYNDVCGNYQYYWYRYAGMMVGTNKNMTTDANGYTVPETDKFHAENCTVHFGEWNDYYYCELVANSLASYTHDHQFSRLTKVDSIDVENMTVTVDDEATAIPASGRCNYVVVNGEAATENATCYHFVDGKVWNHADAGTETVNGETVLKEDKQHYYLPFNQLFTGYGWGVKHIPVYNGEDYAFDGITILDREVADSVVKFETKFTGDFLYRVGNQNTVSLGSLFTAKDGVTINNSGVYVTIDKVDENSDASGTFTANTTDWTKGTIQFSGTGVVKVTIQDYDYCVPTVLYLEVVDAKNTTTASFSGNTVLLNDVSTSSVLSASGVVYGNGFTVNMENAPISEKNGAVFHLYDGAVLKNLGIVGKEFTTVAMNVNDTNYGVSAVRAWGTATIENCYISGCRSAVSVTGTELTIKDSVIVNGVYANVDFRSGILNLHNVTTVNEPHAVNGTTIVGLGIVGNMTASAGRQLNITGTLTQYNWVSQADCNNIKASGVDSIFNSVFTDDKYASLRCTYNGTTYVNTGILSLCSDFGASAVTVVPDNYGGMDVTATISNVTVNGYVWAPNQAGTLTADDMKYHDAVYTWKPNNQGTSYIASAFDFNNSELEAENGVVQIEYESGSSYTLSADTIKALFVAEKYGQPLSYKVTVNGTDYTDKDIVFDATASQTYTITYTITDNLVYDKDGNLTNTTYEVTKTLKAFATVVDKGADAPTFTFYYGTNGSASAGTPHTTQPTNSYTSTIKQVGEAYYIMPNVSATSANAIGSQTVDGVTIYYPIVDGINVRSGNSTDYDFTRYYPVFKAVKISDNGTEYTYSGTTEMPATVAWVSATIDSGNGASSLNSGFGLYNNQYLCKIQTKAGDAESGGTSVVKYSYTALDGNTYYYYVGYRFYDEDEGGLCVTPDTLVTLADGTQKRIDALTGNEQLLVWNHTTGAFNSAPVAYIVDHDGEVGKHEVTHLFFSDGREIKIIGEHVFFDKTLKKYVALTTENAESYIGHRFAVKSGDALKAAKLTKVEQYTEETSVYEVVSYEHITCFTNNILSASAYMDQLLNIFDINRRTMAYNAKDVMKDIETYGLYTYADFEGLIAEEAFELYNAKYLKIAVGKGYITWNDILALIDIYFNVDVQPIQ